MHDVSKNFVPPASLAGQVSQLLAVLTMAGWLVCLSCVAFGLLLYRCGVVDLATLARLLQGVASQRCQSILLLPAASQPVGVGGVSWIPQPGRQQENGGQCVSFPS